MRARPRATASAVPRPRRERPAPGRPAHQRTAAWYRSARRSGGSPRRSGKAWVRPRVRAAQRKVPAAAIERAGHGASSAGLLEDSCWPITARTGDLEAVDGGPGTRIPGVHATSGAVQQRVGAQSKRRSRDRVGVEVQEPPAARDRGREVALDPRATRSAATAAPSLSPSPSQDRSATVPSPCGERQHAPVDGAVIGLGTPATARAPEEVEQGRERHRPPALEGARRARRRTLFCAMQPGRRTARRVRAGVSGAGRRGIGAPNICPHPVAGGRAGLANPAPAATGGEGGGRWPR